MREPGEVDLLRECEDILRGNQWTDVPTIVGIEADHESVGGAGVRACLPAPELKVGDCRSRDGVEVVNGFVHPSRAAGLRASCEAGPP